MRFVPDKLPDPQAMVVDRFKLRIGTEVLVTPFHLPNGDGVSLYRERRGDDVFLHDGGDTFRYLRERPIELTEKRIEHLRAIAKANGVDLLNEAFAIVVSADLEGGAITSLAQAILQASAMHFDPVGPDQSPFASAIDRAISTFVEPVRHVKRRWHHPTKDVEELFPVDYHLNGESRQSRNIFVVTGRQPAQRVVNVLLFLRAEQVAVPSLVLVDVAADLPRTPLRRLQVTGAELAFGEDADAVRDRLADFAQVAQ